MKIRTGFVPKERFCERWPFGYSFEALGDAEQDELYTRAEPVSSM